MTQTNNDGTIRSPRNTTDAMKHPAEQLLFLAGAMGDKNPGDSILAMEAQGAREMLTATTLPTEMSGFRGDGRSAQEQFEALGFTFGDIVGDDPLFRHATLPEGWTREGTDHSMHTSIVDERGLKRVGVFYKAAFYDRSAHMSITSIGGAIASHASYGEPDEPLLPDYVDKLTADELADAATALDDELARANESLTSITARNPDSDYLGTLRERITRIEAAIAELKARS